MPGIFTHTNCFYPHDPLKCYTFPVETQAWQGWLVQAVVQERLSSAYCVPHTTPGETRCLVNTPGGWILTCIPLTSWLGHGVSKKLSRKSMDMKSENSNTDNKWSWCSFWPPWGLIYKTDGMPPVLPPCCEVWMIQCIESIWPTGGILPQLYHLQIGPDFLIHWGKCRRFPMWSN